MDVVCPGFFFFMSVYVHVVSKRDVGFDRRIRYSEYFRITKKQILGVYIV